MASDDQEQAISTFDVDAAPFSAANKAVIDLILGYASKTNSDGDDFVNIDLAGAFVAVWLGEAIRKRNNNLATETDRDNANDQLRAMANVIGAIAQGHGASLTSAPSFEEILEHTSGAPQGFTDGDDTVRIMVAMMRDDIDYLYAKEGFFGDSRLDEFISGPFNFLLDQACLAMAPSYMHQVATTAMISATYTPPIEKKDLPFSSQLRGNARMLDASTQIIDTLFKQSRAMTMSDDVHLQSIVATMGAVMGEALYPYTARNADTPYFYQSQDVHDYLKSLYDLSLAEHEIKNQTKIEAPDFSSFVTNAKDSVGQMPYPRHDVAKEHQPANAPGIDAAIARKPISSIAQKFNLSARELADTTFHAARRLILATGPMASPAILYALFIQNAVAFSAVAPFDLDVVEKDLPKAKRTRFTAQRERAAMALSQPNLN